MVFLALTSGLTGQLGINEVVTTSPGFAHPQSSLQQSEFPTITYVSEPGNPGKFEASS